MHCFISQSDRQTSLLVTNIHSNLLGTFKNVLLIIFAGSQLIKFQTPIFCHGLTNLCSCAKFSSYIDYGGVRCLSQGKNKDNLYEYCTPFQVLPVLVPDLALSIFQVWLERTGFQQKQYFV